MLAGNTEILTVYHGAVSLDDLYNEGKNVLVYSIDNDTKLPVVRMTREIIKHPKEETYGINIHFDSGLTLTCSTDHNLYTFRGDKISAFDLKVGQSVRAFSISLHPTDRHLRAHGWVDGKAKHQYVARLVWECFNGKIPDGLILHHRDFNEVNNKLDNLELLTVTEHNQVHYPFRKQKGFYKRNHKIVKFSVEENASYYYSLVVDRTKNLIVADAEPVAGLASGIVVEN